MINIKNLIIFVLSFVIIYGLLNVVVPKTGMDKWYNNQFVIWGNSFYGEWGEKGRVDFTKIKASKKSIFKHPFKEYDDWVQIKMLNKEIIAEATRIARIRGAQSVQVDHAQFEIDVWKFAVIPIMLVISLILATPVSIPRRLLSLLLGLIGINLFVAFRFWIRFTTELNRHIWLDLGTLGPSLKWFMTHLNTIFMFAGISLIVAVIIWAIVTLRPGDKGLILNIEEE